MNLWKCYKWLVKFTIQERIDAETRRIPETFQTFLFDYLEDSDKETLKKRKGLSWRRWNRAYTLCYNETYGCSTYPSEPSYPERQITDEKPYLETLRDDLEQLSVPESVINQALKLYQTDWKKGLKIYGQVKREYQKLRQAQSQPKALVN